MFWSTDTVLRPYILPQTPGRPPVLCEDLRDQPKGSGPVGLFGRGRAFGDASTGA